MPFRIQRVDFDMSTGALRRARRYAFYDWTREMPKSKRLITWAGILLQGYAIYAAITRSLVWPFMWPEGLLLYASVGLLYLLGAGLLNGMLTSEFLRKTRMESDQMAARRIQQTLQPEAVEAPRGYEVEAFSQPFRDVGGDYFDVVALPMDRTLFAVADVSGKGMAAALLAANLQALVRSIASVDGDPLQLAVRINQHLSRYTPGDRFATAVFIVLTRQSGHLTYVNAGHNAPVVFGAGSPTLLEASGMPLGMFSDATYETRSSVIPPGGTLLVFTDGLTDSIPGDNPEARLCNALARDSGRAISTIRSLADPKLTQDDVTILLVKRAAA